MDEVLALSAVDLSGRPYLKYNAEFTVLHSGTLDTEMVRDFLRCLLQRRHESSPEDHGTWQ